MKQNDTDAYEYKEEIYCIPALPIAEASQLPEMPYISSTLGTLLANALGAAGTVSADQAADGLHLALPECSHSPAGPSTNTGRTTHRPGGPLHTSFTRSLHKW